MSTLQGRSARGHGKDHLRTSAARGRNKHRQLETQHVPPHLNVGSVALALLPVDVQPELLVHLTDLGSAVNEVDPRRLAPLPLVGISRQVIQQL